MADCGYESIKHVHSAAWAASGLPTRGSAVSGAAPPWSHAALAQPVEHIIRNDGVRCSSHLSGTMAFGFVEKAARGRTSLRYGHPRNRTGEPA